ncbi:ATP-binding protein [Streptomyces sp. NPDC057499]|uniref:ATP-binding protein n=1 Tax=Streptomyces sp. NPDC057499 TaxID=3346150 RepID=UPI003689BB26
MPNAVGLARLHAIDVLARWGVSSGIVEATRLLVSELTTNAVRYPEKGAEQASPFSARKTVQTFELLLEVVHGAVRVSVWDRDARPPVLKEVGAEATDGRGIFLVAMMSRDWGHYPARGRPGKVVWAEIPLAPVSRVGENEESAGCPSRPPLTGLRAPRVAPVDRDVLGGVLAGFTGPWKRGTPTSPTSPRMERSCLVALRKPCSDLDQYLDSWGGVAPEYKQTSSATAEGTR